MPVSRPLVEACESRAPDGSRRGREFSAGGVEFPVYPSFSGTTCTAASGTAPRNRSSVDPRQSIEATGTQRVRFLEHLVRLADAGRGADVDPQARSIALLDARQQGVRVRATADG